MTPETDALIKFRLEQADHTLHGAVLMLDAEERFGVTRQIYFAMFTVRWRCWRASNCIPRSMPG